MNAVLLCAGRGTRLRPLTDHTAKPMVPVGGKPLLQHTVERLVGAGFRTLFINLHAFPAQIRAHFGNGSEFGCRIEYLEEPVLLGSAGTVHALAPQLRGGGDFLVWYGDNFAELDVPAFWQRHQSERPLMTVALHWRDDVSQSGAVVQGDEGGIVRFIEKPLNGGQGWVNGGIYACAEALLDCLPDHTPADFGYHVFPALLAAGERLQGYRMTEFLLGVDTPASYAALRARLEALADPT